MTYWDPLSAPIDYLLVAGSRSPGIAEIVGAVSPRKWDERAGYGLSGSTLVFKGVGLVTFTIKLRLYTEYDWVSWRAWRTIVEKPPLGTRAKAVSVWHPFLEELGVTAAVVNELGQPAETAPGEWTIAIKMTEFRAPKVALAKPEGAKAAPVDPYDQIITDLTKQVQELSR
jgi:hypothetical protein